MFSKFLSRKFLLSLAVVAASAFGVDLPWEAIVATVGYVVGEGAIDASRAFNQKPSRGD